MKAARFVEKCKTFQTKNVTSMWQIFATNVCILSRAGKPTETGSTFLAPTLDQVKFYRNARTAANTPLHTVFNSYQMVWLCYGLRASALHCSHKVMVQNR